MSIAATDQWQGIATEDAEDVTAGLSTFLRRRSRRLLASLIQPHRVEVMQISALIIVANLCILAGPWLAGVAVDRVPQLTRSHDVVPIAVVIAAFAAAMITQAIATRAYIGGIGRVGASIVLDLRRRLFRHFQALPVAFHERYTSGRVVSRQVSDIDALSELFDEGLDTVVSAILSLLLVGSGMLLLDWCLALVVMTAFIPLIWLSVWFRRRSEIVYRLSRETIAEVIVHFVETLRGIRAVQAFRRERRNEEVFAELNGAYASASLRSYRLLAVFFPGVTLVTNLAIGIVLLYGGLRVIDHQMQVGVLVTFLLYLERFFDPLQNLSQFYSTFKSAASALEKVSGVLDQASAVPEPTSPVDLPTRDAGLETCNRATRGRTVQLESISFGYRDAPVLNHFNLDIPAGQTVALVGATGSGKTTIARLLARFYDPTSGRILLDGVDLRQLTEKSLRREIVLITQENHLFNGSIADNIALGNPTASRGEIEAAATAIGADKLISALPAGYDEQVGKRGGRLSAGQRQVISFARAFLAAPAVLVLDEATALMDAPSERLVQKALTTILAERTALIIAHRLSTVKIADRVLVLDHGQIVEDGPPGMLLSGHGHYSQLHSRWREGVTVNEDCDL